MSEAEAWFPAKLRFLFQPARYKVVRGGRGSGKSWGFARALLIEGGKRPLRVLCTREVQKSIQQSVYQLLKDQIAGLGLGSFYDVLATEIRGRNGTQFFFSGLSEMTAESLKSFEGVDVCWVEEAQSVTKNSWDILIPTIRKEGSEIWVSFNPQLESDETYRRFVVTPPPDCVSVEMNYSDNRKFPAVLEAERKHAKATMKPEEYAHIWEGQCKPAVEGAIYFDQMAQAKIREVPHDGQLKTHAIWDLGFNDSMAIILAQKVSSEIRVVAYIEGAQRTLADYSAELKALRLDNQPMNWGQAWLPHDGFAARHQTGKTDAQVLKGLGWEVRKVPGAGSDVESGIKRAREVFPRVYFNKTRTERLIECLKRYRRHVSQATGEPGRPVHDEFSHGADAFRYLAMCADELTNDNGDFDKPLSVNTKYVV